MLRIYSMHATISGIEVIDSIHDFQNILFYISIPSHFILLPQPRVVLLSVKNNIKTSCDNI